MHIAFVLADLRVGGAEVNAVHLSRLLGERGHHVTIVAGAGPLASTLDRSRVTHVARAMRLKRPWTILAAAAALRAVHRKRPIDVVHAFMASGSVAAAMAALSLGGRRFPIVAAPPGFRDRDEPAVLSRLRLRALAAGADLVLVPSRAFLADCLSIGIPPTRLEVVPFNATVIERFSGVAASRDLLTELDLEPADPLITSLARLHPTKGQDLLLRAAPRILATCDRARFLLVGEGPWRAHLASLARSLRIEHAVRFAGQRADVPGILGMTTVLAQTTFGYGGPGISVIEAFAAGVPVVGMSFPDLEDSVGSSGGAMLVPHGDVTAFADAVVRIIRDPVLARRMGDDARIHAARNFDMRTVAATLERIYRSTARTTDAPPPA